jgi:hypothetical protein
VVDEIEPEVESDLRRRAAWLLGMLVVVAILFVVVMTAVMRDDTGNSNVGQSGPLDGLTTAGAPSSSSRPPAHRTSSSGSKAPTSSATTHGPATCPTAQRCALDDDIGNAVAAVNAYRTEHGQAAVSGAVSAAAKQCALNNGNGCTGTWAESQVPGPDGKKAVDKIAQLAKLLSPMKSFGVGWAYDPASKEYFFAIVRTV